MGLVSKAQDSKLRFVAYVEAIVLALEHADRVVPLKSYCAGLLLPGDRKSVEPMAARVQPARVRATHQSLHHVVAKSEWSDDGVLAAVCAHVLPIVEGGFRWSSQHFVGVGCDGNTQAALGLDGTRGDALAWPAICGAA